MNELAAAAAEEAVEAEEEAAQKEAWKTRKSWMLEFRRRLEAVSIK